MDKNPKFTSKHDVFKDHQGGIGHKLRNSVEMKCTENQESMVM